MHELLEIVLDTFIDCLKILPFLFLTYLLMEYIEHKTTSKTRELIKRADKFGPFIGSILGAFPQCGFSVSATNLYTGRVITMGTLISVYLSTSDEMLPIMLSRGVNISTILQIIGVKVLIGMIAGVLIDFIFRKTNHKKNKDEISHMCKEEHCHCEQGIVKSSIKHTFNILFFIAIISLILNIIIYIIGEEALSNIISNKPILGPILAGMIGLIPNCAASVILTELYLTKILSIGTLIAGLLVGAGVGFLVLFRVNKNMKENLSILGILYGIGVISGIVINFIW